MNGADSKIIQQPLARFNFGRAMFQVGLIATGIIFLFFIIIMKANSGADWGFEPTLFIYTIFITTFQLSRLIAAMFYENSYAGLIKNNGKADSSGNFVAGALNGMAEYRIFEPTVTFVIPCKNEEEAITNTVNNCFRADYPKNKLEVIVINDGSTDATPEKLNKLKAKYEKLTVVDWKINRGKKQAMAQGFRMANGEIVIQLDSDSFINPKTFRKIIEPFENQEVGAVSAHTDPMNADQNILTKMQSAYYFTSFRILKAAESTFATVLCCSGCASAYRKEYILHTLDEWLGEKFLGSPVTWGDDRALTSRVLKQGYKTLYTNQATARTIVPDSFARLIKQQVRWKKSWFVNALYNSKFILKTQPFVALTYFFPLIAISFLSPIMSARALVYLPIVKGVLPFYHIFGLMLVAAIFASYYRLVASKNKYWPYFFLWSIFNLFILSFLMFYSLARLNDRRWGTR